MTRDRPFFFPVKCEMANFFLVNHDFHSSREAWFCKIIFRETRNKCLIRRELWFSFCLCYFQQPLLRNKWYCVTVTGWLIPVETRWLVVFGDLWPAIIFILCFVYFNHPCRMCCEISGKCWKTVPSFLRTPEAQASSHLNTARSWRDNEICFWVPSRHCSISADIAGQQPFQTSNMYAVTLCQGFWDCNPGISKKNDTVVHFLIHTLNIILSYTLDTNSP